MKKFVICLFAVATLCVTWTMTSDAGRVVVRGSAGVRGGSDGDVVTRTRVRTPRVRRSARLSGGSDGASVSVRSGGSY